MLEKGWLKQQLESVEQEVRLWPTWVHNIRIPHHLQLSKMRRSDTPTLLEGEGREKVKSYEYS